MRYKKILVVDDSATSRMIVRRCLEMAGYSDATFLEAGDGALALDLLEMNPVDLIVTDLKMPRMDGRTLVRKLQSNPATSDIPVLVVSSVASAEEHSAFGSNVVTAVQKPLSPAKLMHALKE
ncbi:MAG: response regulator [Spirochaetaceae bacterium]|nr:response regulator [Spirochaetaceae bacterium]